MSGPPRITNPEWLGRHAVYDGTNPDGSLRWIRPGFWDRPPLGPALRGRSSAAAGRGHRRSHTAEAKARRVALAYRALQLRGEGLTVRAIATRLGVGKTTVGRWLYQVEAGGLEFAPRRFISHW